MPTAPFVKTGTLREVFLMLPSLQEANREMIRGIYDFALPGRRWAFFHVNQSAEAIRRIGGLSAASGLIGLLGRADLAEAASAISLPTVNIHDGTVFNRLPQVGADGYRLGQFAAEALCESRVEHFGFFGLKDENFSDVRLAGFRDRLASLGQSQVETFFRDPAMIASGKHFGERNPAMEWLLGLPKPIAIYCANDVFANELSVTCFQAGIRIPQQVMVLGTDNDPVWGLGAHPPISTIQLPYREIGRRAARMLQKLMRGQKLGRKVIRLHQPELIERQSTMRQHADDAVVEKALQWMQAHAREGASMAEVAAAVNCSVRALEMRFQKTLGRSPGSEMKRLRLAVVKHLLREEDLTLEAIAEHCRFSSGIYLSQFFKRETGVTPGAYRKAFRT